MALAESILGIESDVLRIEMPLLESACAIMLGVTSNEGEAGLSSSSGVSEGGEAAADVDGMRVDEGRFLGKERQPAKRSGDRRGCQGGNAGGSKMLKMAAMSSGDKIPS